jgi:hypothetical protein
MQSLTLRNGRYLLWSLAGVAVLAADSVHAVKESLLWLPRAQSEFKPLLVQAAELAESSEECEEVISGELDTERSAQQAPVFRIVCRNPGGYTYSVFVTDAGKPNAQLEKVQGGADASASNASDGPSRAGSNAVDEKTARKSCLASLKMRTSRMTGVKLDESNLQRLASETGLTQYEMDFDAADPAGMALHFHATCRVTASGTALVEVRPRRAASESSAAKPPLAPPQKAHDAVEPEPATPSSPRQGDKQATPKQEDNGKTEHVDEDGWEVVE